jgi:hypothetical protein
MLYANYCGVGSYRVPKGAGVTADNGLNINTPGNVQLGGQLLQNTAIDSNLKDLTVDHIASLILNSDLGDILIQTLNGRIDIISKGILGLTSVSNDISIQTANGINMIAGSVNINAPTGIDTTLSPVQIFGGNGILMADSPSSNSIDMQTNGIIFNGDSFEGATQLPLAVNIPNVILRFRINGANIDVLGKQ